MFDVLFTACPLSFPSLHAMKIQSMATRSVGASLQAINAQIAVLEAKADALRKKEVSDVVAKIKDAIAHYGLTAEDLGLSKPERPKAAKKDVKALTPQSLKRKPGTAGRRGVESTVLKGGYRVYGTLVEPQHFTREQIANAVAKTAHVGKAGSSHGATRR